MALVVIQLGHCYRTRGATGTGGVDGDPTEQGFATAAGHRAAGLLEDAGHGARVILADEPSHMYAGDAFVAIHCDGSTNPAAHGASVGYRTPEGAAFGAAWKRAYAARGWSGFRPDNNTANLAGYYGTREAVARGNRHAFIAEAGFLTSPADEAQLSLPHGPERFATALVAAVVEMFGGFPPPPIEEDDMGMFETPEQAVEHFGFGASRALEKIGLKTPDDVVQAVNNGVLRALQGETAAALLRQYGLDAVTSDEARAVFGDDVDEAALAGFILGTLTPEAIAAAIPETLAQDVADVLAERLSG